MTTFNTHPLHDHTQTPVAADNRRGGGPDLCPEMVLAAVRHIYDVPTEGTCIVMRASADGSGIEGACSVTLAEPQQAAPNLEARFRRVAQEFLTPTDGAIVCILVPHRAPSRTALSALSLLRECIDHVGPASHRWFAFRGDCGIEINPLDVDAPPAAGAPGDAHTTALGRLLDIDYQADAGLHLTSLDGADFADEPGLPPAETLQLHRIHTAAREAQSAIREAYDATVIHRETESGSEFIKLWRATVAEFEAGDIVVASVAQLARELHFKPWRDLLLDHLFAGTLTQGSTKHKVATVIGENFIKALDDSQVCVTRDAERWAGSYAMLQFMWLGLQPQDCAPALTLLGLLDWFHGDGILAADRFTAATTCAPGYTLAELCLNLVNAPIVPAWLRASMRTQASAS